MEGILPAPLRRVLAKGSRVRQVVVPVIGGGLVAAFCTILPEKAGWVWVFLVAIGLLAWIPPFVVRNPRAYWLGLFLLALPFNLTKTFGTEERIRTMLEQVGGVWGQNTLILQAADLPFLVLLGDWLIRLATGRTSLRFPRIAWLPLGYLIWVTVGAVFAAHPSLSFFEILREYKLFLVFLYVVNNARVEYLGRLIVPCVLFGVLLQSGVTLVRYGTQSFTNVFGEAFGTFETASNDLEKIQAGVESRSSDRTRGYGTFQHPNVTAMHLAFTLPLAFVLVLRQRRFRWIIVALLLLGLAGLYVTFSRGGLVALGAGLTVLAVIGTERNWIPRYLLWVASALVVLTLPLIVPPIHRYLTTRPEYFDQRLEHFQVGLRMIWINPIMGVGLNNSTPYRPRFSPGGATWEETDFPLHSYHLLILIETGFVGFALYYGFFALAALRAYRLTGSDHFFIALMASAVLAGYAALAVHLTVDFLNLDALQMLLWFFTGLIVGLPMTARGPINPIATSERPNASIR